MVSLRLDWGRAHFQGHVAASGVPFLAEGQTEGLSFLLAMSQKLPSVPCLMALSMWQLTVLLQSQEEGEYLLARQM